MGTVYEIHLFRPLGHPCSDEERAARSLNPRRAGSRFQAGHYIGYAKRSLSARLAEHESGNGSAFMAAVVAQGIPWVVARTWKNGTRTLERRLKNQKHAARLCPICNPSGWARHMPQSGEEHAKNP